MKGKTKSTILCIAICALAVTAAAQTTWKLSKDLLETNNQISFNQGAKSVWYFLQSNSFAHAPRTYEFLAAYNNPCIGDSTTRQINGLACWQNPIPDSVNNLVPIIEVNFTFADQIVKNFAIPRRSVVMHPSSHGLAIIGWKSPINGSVDVSGFFSDVDPTCDNGVIWSVDKENNTLVSGTITNGGPPQTFAIAGVSVTAGQVLYFTVDPNNGDYACDTTGVDVTLTASK
jgi:hypothetical protein